MKCSPSLCCRLTLSLLAALALCCGGAQFTEEEDVLVLTASDFKHAVAQHKHLLVMFYAPWCARSKALAPDYATVARVLKEQTNDTRLAKVDVTRETELRERYRIEGYPTFKFFRMGKVERYTAGRGVADFLAWLKKQTGPIALTVATVEEARAVISREDVVLFGFFADLSTDAVMAFLEVAVETDDTIFAITSTEEVLREFDVRGEGIVVFRKQDGERVRMGDRMTIANITAFLAGNRLPVVTEYSPAASQKIFGGLIQQYVILFISKKDENFDSTLKNLKQAAVRYNTKVVFTYINIDEDENLEILDFFKMKPEDCPAVRFINLEDEMVRYKPDTTELTTSAIRSFIEHTLGGKQKQDLLSEKLPEDWNAKPVKVLVSENFYSVTQDRDRSAFVLFYAPWCAYSKELAPVWEQLGDKYVNRSDVVIAKMDSTANELEDIKILDFPTLKYFSKNSAKAVDYAGERTVEALSKFLEYDGKIDSSSSTKPDKVVTDSSSSQSNKVVNEGLDATDTVGATDSNTKPGKEEL